MSDLTLTFQKIVDEVAEFLEMGPTPVDRDLTKVKRAVYKGYRRLLYPNHPTSRKRHVWSWLKVWDSIQTIDSQWKYALPKDFSNIIGDIVYGASEVYDRITKVDTHNILLRRTANIINTYPDVFAINSQKTTDDIGTRWEMWFDPVPNGSYEIRYRYLANPAKPENATDYFKGNVDALECLQELCLGAAEQQELKTFGEHSKVGRDMLNDLVLADETDTADSLGFLEGTNNDIDPTRYPRKTYTQLDIDNIYSS